MLWYSGMSIGSCIILLYIHVQATVVQCKRGENMHTSTAMQIPQLDGYSWQEFLLFNVTRSFHSQCSVLYNTIIRDIYQEWKGLEYMLVKSGDSTQHNYKIFCLQNESVQFRNNYKTFCLQTENVLFRND